VFFIPGGAAYVAWSVLQASRGALRGASRVTWCGWSVSCTGMRIPMIAELSGASPTINYDGLYGAFGVLNALAVVILMWTPSRTALADASRPATGRGPATAR
jgi:Na+-driven multidrug efflux pump